MHDRTPDAPFPDACRKRVALRLEGRNAAGRFEGRKFIAPCCTASLHEFLADGILHLASSVAGHRWSAAWPSRIEDVNDDGWIIEADGSERRIRWQGDREGR